MNQHLLLVSYEETSGAFDLTSSSPVCPNNDHFFCILFYMSKIQDIRAGGIVRNTTIAFYLVLAVLTLWIHAGASACQVDEFYLTNGGNLAGTTQDNLSKAEKADPQSLADMIENRGIIRLQDNIKVQAIERSVEYKMIKIKLPDSDFPVWVREDALKRIQQ